MMDCDGIYEPADSHAALLYRISHWGSVTQGFTEVLRCSGCGDWWIVGLRRSESQTLPASCADSPDAAFFRALEAVGQRIPNVPVWA